MQPDLRHVRRALTRRYGILIAALLLTLVLSRKVARSVAQPLQDLSQLMREISASGDFSRRVHRPPDGVRHWDNEARSARGGITGPNR